MKRTTIALAACILGGTAAAQSSVTLFGIVDTGVSVGRGSIANRTQVSNSGLASSRLGFRGTEDLGGGLSASFWLEAGLNSDNGTGTTSNTNNQTTGAGAAAGGSQGIMFGRKATVGIGSTRWGELRLGRDYTPSFLTVLAYDAFNYSGVGLTVLKFANSYAAAAQTGVRASNAIEYLTPAMGGFFAHAMYALGENASNAANEDDGDYVDVRVGYAAGPWSVSASHGRTKFASGDISKTHVGGFYDAGFAKVMALVSRDRVDAAAKATGRHWQLGVLVPVGVGIARASYGTYRVESATDPAVSQLSLGYIHNLSKRTALYWTWAKVKNRNSAAFSLNGSATAAGRSSSGMDFGLRHTF